MPEKKKVSGYVLTRTVLKILGHMRATVFSSLTETMRTTFYCLFIDFCGRYCVCLLSGSHLNCVKVEAKRDTDLHQSHSHMPRQKMTKSLNTPVLQMLKFSGFSKMSSL